MADVVTWDATKLAYRVNGAVLDKNVVLGGADSVIVEVQARISRLADQLREGKITLDEWYQSMQFNTKMLAGAETALARGGWEQMRPQDWDRASDVALEQWEGKPGKFPGLRRFSEDVLNGRYGKGILSDGFANRANMYADIGHAIYVNARMANHIEEQYTLASRELGFSDHCPDCVAWADLGKIPIEDMEASYPMGSSVCGSFCRCDIFFYRGAVE